MYEQHFNFTSLPFSIAPNPRFIYLSSQHREALAHLLFGISAGGGFVALTGEVGTGKTTLCRCLLEQLPEDVDIALIFNPRLNAKELLAAICDELRIAHPEQRSSIKQLIDRLNRHLLDAYARGRRTVVLIDEAQNLSYDVLEQIRLLTNLETNEAKLLQIILVGQPELKALLGRPNLRQLAQRITARYHLLPLTWRDTELYIRHRLAVSGAKQPVFSRAAMASVYRHSKGIPRLINLICDRALLGAYTLGKFTVNPAIVRKAAREALPEVANSHRRVVALASLAASLALAAILQQLGWISVADWVSSGAPHGEKVSVQTTPEVSGAPLPLAAIPTAAPAISSAPAVAATQTPENAPTVATASPAASVEPLPASSPLAGAEPPNEAEEAIPTPTPAEQAPREPFAALLSTLGASREAEIARLLALWGVTLPVPASDGCVLARQHGLRCLPLKTGWLALLGLNHPAVLEFKLVSGDKRYAALTGLSEGKALLESNGKVFPVEPAELAPFWQGDALIVWKPPFDKASIGLGENGDTVRWIRQRLAVPAPPDYELVFDQKLKERVIAFQNQEGLMPDGRVGPMTTLHLQQLTDTPDAPRLGVHRD